MWFTVARELDGLVAGLFASTSVISSSAFLLPVETPSTSRDKLFRLATVVVFPFAWLMIPCVAWILPFVSEEGGVGGRLL